MVSATLPTAAVSAITTGLRGSSISCLRILIPLSWSSSAGPTTTVLLPGSLPHKLVELCVVPLLNLLSSGILNVSIIRYEPDSLCICCCRDPSCNHDGHGPSCLSPSIRIKLTGYVRDRLPWTGDSPFLASSRISSYIPQVPIIKKQK